MLKIGDPRAENKMTTLDLITSRSTSSTSHKRRDQPRRGPQGLGQDGALHPPRDKARADRRNIVLDLKPEGYQLIKSKRTSSNYLSEGARQHPVTAFWEYLIYPEIAYKLLEKDQKAHRYNRDIHDAYIELSGAYNAKNFSPEGDFSERLAALSERLALQFIGKSTASRTGAG